MNHPPPSAGAGAPAQPPPDARAAARPGHRDVKNPAGGGRWLVKQEPESYSWEDFGRDGRTSWEGVRNYQARNNLKGMHPGDRVLFYASGDSKSVVGIAAVAKAAYPDPTAREPGWVAVELEAVRRLNHPVTLAQIRAAPALAGALLLRNSRLSVMPVTRAEFDEIVRMGS